MRAVCSRSLAALVVAVVLAGCGSSSHPAASSNSDAASSSVAASVVLSLGSTGTTAPTTTAPPVGALTGEAASAAAGDIPDNQVFLAYADPSGWSIKYPEGWAQTGTGHDVTFRDKNNVVHIVVRPGPAPTAASVRADLAALSSTTPSIRASTPAAIRVGGTPMIKVTYTTESAPNAVTGKSVKLTVDRYVFAHSGSVAVVDLGTPVGVDNVDAYRLMIESFRWR
jgi:hypothetical protein